MNEIAKNLKRSSSNTKKLEGMDLKLVPDEMFRDNFRLSQNFFTIKNQEEAAQNAEKLNKHLEIVEANLGREITNNFDKFSIAFENFDEIKADLREVQK